MQAKLLRVLQEGEIERVGGTKAIAVSVRVVVATHRNLESLVREGQFRQDLYHRVYVYPLTLPPLRERSEDLPVLLDHFARAISEQNGWKPRGFTRDVVDVLARYDWPGNVRELRNVVERLLLLADCEVDGDAVRLALPAIDHDEWGAVAAANRTLAERVHEFERAAILAELKRQKYRMVDAARALGLERSHLYKKCQQHEIDFRTRTGGDEPLS
jgi:DNA-binding NtrC family response regulator